MCLVKDNFSSMITPKNFMKLTRFKEMLLRQSNAKSRYFSRFIKDIKSCPSI